MKSNKEEASSFPFTVVGGVGTAVIWTLVAGTLWQWVPIMAAVGAYVGVRDMFSSSESKERKGRG
jgi:hypothetical protein